VGAVVTESFARIFYRNAINVGLPALECRGIAGAVEEGDTLEIDVDEGTIVDADNGVRLNFSPMPGFMVDVLKEGGLVPYMRKQMGRW
jgi:3-isopropylmalate dehydratase small subunit